MGSELPNMIHRYQLTCNRLMKISDQKASRNIFILDILHVHPWLMNQNPYFIKNNLSFIVQIRLLLDIQGIMTQIFSHG